MPPSSLPLLHILLGVWDVCHSSVVPRSWGMCGVLFVWIVLAGIIIIVILSPRPRSSIFIPFRTPAVIIIVWGRTLMVWKCARVTIASRGGSRMIMPICTIIYTLVIRVISVIPAPAPCIVGVYPIIYWDFRNIGLFVRSRVWGVTIPVV